MTSQYITGMYDVTIVSSIGDLFCLNSSTIKPEQTVRKGQIKKKPDRNLKQTVQKGQIKNNNKQKPEANSFEKVKSITITDRNLNQTVRKSQIKNNDRQKPETNSAKRSNQKQ